MVTKIVPDKVLGEITPLLKVISSPLRLKILNFLEEEEKAVFEIVGFTGASQALVSHHLTIMRKNRVIRCRKEKNFIYYSIGNDYIYYFLESIRTLKSSCPDKR
ncbi:MAG: winged helix-turn-helix transcriptional regulator [Nitrospinae bacterium]|nr:winged helix-turn-helix transcriptional regulator [Nitrospinota bacterium]